MSKVRTNIEIEDTYLQAIMDRYGVHTKTEAVDLALRHLAGQPMTREEALRSWTIEGAYAAFEEKSKGSLVPGKLADFVVLSDDIMHVPAARILKTRVTMTVVGGELVYSQ